MLLSDKLEKLNLSKRTYILLKNNDIHTLQDLCYISPYDLKMIRGCGSKTYKEIYELLNHLKEKYNIDSSVIKDSPDDYVYLHYRDKYIIGNLVDINKEDNIYVKDCCIYIEDFKSSPNKLPHIKLRNYNILRTKLGTDKTYEEIGIEYNLTKSRIEQICKSTLNKVRKQYIEYILLTKPFK